MEGGTQTDSIHKNFLFPCFWQFLFGCFPLSSLAFDGLESNVLSWCEDKGLKSGQPGWGNFMGF
jgi:hypothetical protein